MAPSGKWSSGVFLLPQLNDLMVSNIVSTMAMPQATALSDMTMKQERVIINTFGGKKKPTRLLLSKPWWRIFREILTDLGGEVMMNQNKDRIKIGLATEDQVNREFISAWHQAEQGTLTEAEEHLYFIDLKTFLQILSPGRLNILYTLRAQGKTSIQALSQMLARKYQHVYRDVQILKKAGLIQEAEAAYIFVPWDKIQAEIDLLSAVPIE